MRGTWSHSTHVGDRFPRREFDGCSAATPPLPSARNEPSARKDLNAGTVTTRVGDSSRAMHSDTVSNSVNSSAAGHSGAFRDSRTKVQFWLILIGGLAATAVIYRANFAWLWRTWNSNDDYSHGILIPFVSVFILWTRRDRLESSATGDRLALSFGIGAGAVMLGLMLRLAGIYTSILTLESLSLIPFLFGLVAIVAGWSVALWATPALLYLLFMIPLPGFLGGSLSGVLQSVGTTISVFALQTVGVPAVAHGNVIHLWQGTIGVAEACSGLRMLYAFVALCVGACLIMEKTWLERVLIIASAVPIAIAVNCFRITATGLAYEYSDSETAEHIFHDLAGWLMVPIGFVMLMAVIEILRRLIVTDERELAAA